MTSKENCKIYFKKAVFQFSRINKWDVNLFRIIIVIPGKEELKIYKNSP